MSLINPHVSIVSPFPFDEMPVVSVWIEAARDSIGNDLIPKSVREFMQMQATRWQNLDELITTGIWNRRELCGYFESVALFGDVGQVKFGIQAEVPGAALAFFVFRSDAWPQGIMRTALNLCLHEHFDKQLGLIYFRVLAHLSWHKRLLEYAGGRSLGLTSPTMQGRREVATELYGISEPEWRKVNEKFLAELAARDAVLPDPGEVQDETVYVEV